MYDESQGIVDIAVKLYMLAQWSVIGEESEQLTPERIRSVAKNNFHAARPILQALRLNDIAALGKIKDLLPQSGDVDQFLAKAVKRVTLAGTVETLQNQEQQKLYDRKELLESPESQIAALLVGAGYPISVSQQSAHQAVKRYATATDLKLATSEAFRLAAEQEIQARELAPPPQQIPKITKPAKRLSMSGDLREIAKPALEKKITAYEELKAAGVIKPAGEFLVVVDS